MIPKLMEIELLSREGYGRTGTWHVGYRSKSCQSCQATPSKNRSLGGAVRVPSLVSFKKIKCNLLLDATLGYLTVPTQARGIIYQVQRK